LVSNSNVVNVLKCKGLTSGPFTIPRDGKITIFEVSTKPKKV
jgi:hypothetical protein